MNESVLLMNEDVLKALTLEVRTTIPIKERAEVSCRFLWERILSLKEAGDSPTILRLSRHGMQLAKIAQSKYFIEIFTSMRGAMERRLSA